MHTTTWKTWTDTNGKIGEMLHDRAALATYFRRPDGVTAMFPWSKFDEAGEAEGHIRAIAWGRSSQHVHADDVMAQDENLGWYAGAFVCDHLVRKNMACDDCTDEAAEADRVASSEVIRLDLEPLGFGPVEAELRQKLEQLAAEYDVAEAAAKAAAERFDSIKTGIKATAQLIAPNHGSITIVSDDLQHSLSLTQVTRRNVDTKRLRVLCEQAGVDYQTLTRPSTSWTLRKIK